MNFDFERSMNIYKIQLSLLSPQSLEMIHSKGKVMVIASMYPARRIVVKAIKCEYTSILDNILLLKTLGYVSYKCSVKLEHYYVYTKCILLQTLRYVSYRYNVILEH